MKKSLELLGVVLLLTGCLVHRATVLPISTSSSGQVFEGESGIGDTYYPGLGNGGYEVDKYTIVLSVDPLSNAITGKTTIEATAQERLEAFNLDFNGLEIDSIIVNEASATFRRADGELTIMPAAPLDKDKPFKAVVQYHGDPQPIQDIAASDTVGWFHAPDGVINVMSEPNGASTWYPVNDHPRDKATYRFEITVPKPWVVAATGDLSTTTDMGDRTLYVWEMNQPMASYLASINIGKYKLFTQSGPNGILVRDYFPEDYPVTLQTGFDSIPAMLSYFSKLFGPYPFDQYGVVIADKDSFCAEFDGADETQSMSIHCPGPGMASEAVIAHELAHQWFGDSVSLENWQDVWLKEGIATYTEWLWETHTSSDIRTLNDIVENNRKNYRPTVPVGNPLATDLYRPDAYQGGAFVFHALRMQVGDEAFFRILQTYQQRYRYSNAGTAEFIALAEEISGQNLKTFFDTWLFSEAMPEKFPEPAK